MDTVHEFTLILEGINELTSDLASTIYGTCDDASIVQQAGCVRIDFDRSAPTMEDAIFSAIADVLKSGVDAHIRLDPNSAGSAHQMAANVNSVVQRIEPIFEMQPAFRSRALQLINAFPEISVAQSR